MNSTNTARARVILLRALGATRATFVEDASTAWTEDPTFSRLKRNRVNAEILKAALALPAEDAEQAGYTRPFLTKIVTHLIHSQNADGGWNEVHPNYDAPSALKTSFIGEALLAAREAKLADVDASLRKARDHVLRNEVSPGRYLKSESYLADHLNVNAACGSFLASHAQAFRDEPAAKAAGRAITHTLHHMREDGELPYTTSEGGAPYPYPLDVPCIHYQGVTLFYLWKAADTLRVNDHENAMLRGAEWLMRSQRPNGRFDWGRSGMMMAYGLTGAYAFAYAVFARAAKADPRFGPAAGRAIAALDEQVPGIAWRWERASLLALPASVPAALRAAFHGSYPLSHRAFRIGYGMYRETARRRASQQLEAKTFHRLARIMKIKTSIIEAEKNFPDLFMTSEIVDCLGHALHDGGTQP